MKISEICSDEVLQLAKQRAAARATDRVYSFSDRARAALLSYADCHDDWDQINAWFDELNRKRLP